VKWILEEMDLKLKILMVAMCRNQKVAKEILFEIFFHIVNISLGLLLTWQDMAKGFMFGSFVNIWDFCENEWVKIGIRTCRNPSFVLIYGLCGMENCMVVSIEIMHEAFKERSYFAHLQQPNIVG
jgi:hypothetical protein